MLSPTVSYFPRGLGLAIQQGLQTSGGPSGSQVLWSQVGGCGALWRGHFRQALWVLLTFFLINHPLASRGKMAGNSPVSGVWRCLDGSPQIPSTRLCWSRQEGGAVMGGATWSGNRVGPRPRRSPATIMRLTVEWR